MNLLEDEAILDLFVKMPKIGTLVLKVGKKCSSKELPYQRIHIFVIRSDGAQFLYALITLPRETKL